MKRCALALLMLAAVFAAGCDDHYNFKDQAKESLTTIHTDQTFFKDQHGRYLLLHGVNLSGSSKVPATTDPEISYVGKPLKPEEMDHHFRILRDLGFNTLRLLVIWEGIEPEGPGQYDTKYLDYIESVVAKAEQYGIYVFLDMHQDEFSRHLFVLYNDGTGVQGLKDQHEIAAAAPYGFNNRIGGDGAPRWAVQMCLPEKDVSDLEWGLPSELASDPHNTSDLLPLTMWGINMFISQDIGQCSAMFLAGDAAYPDYFVNGVQVMDFLQNDFAAAWAQLAKRVGGYTNVLGYDIYNEPLGIYIMPVINALLFQKIEASPDKSLTDAEMDAVIESLLAGLRDVGMPANETEILKENLSDWAVLPRNLDELKSTGFVPKNADAPWRPDVAGIIALNSSFNRFHMQPFLSRVAKAISAEDPDAIFFVEGALGLSDQGVGGQWAEPMTRPEGMDQIAYAPHFYTDIYPFIGFNEPPRNFTVEEVSHRDYSTPIADAVSGGAFSLGNPPVVLGEYGTYFNLGGIVKSTEQNYLISSLILNPYYEAFEKMLISHTQWCYSPENTATNGEGWNKEDFSVLGFDGKPRSWEAYSRPYPRFASGRVKDLHFYSPLHYFEPYPNRQTPKLEFVMDMGAKETDAPTEIFVPPLQYPDGFYVYLSDGRCAYDDERRILYWYPENDDPQAEHSLRLRPPYERSGDENWNYFFHGDQVLEGVQ